MTEETRDTLRYVLIQDPAISGAADYKALCLAAKNEE